MTNSPGHVKSYANVVTKISQKPLSSISSLPSTWSWTYTGSNIIANVAYDLFTSSTATGRAEYEVMIWLAGLGGAGTFFLSFHFYLYSLPHALCPHLLS